MEDAGHDEPIYTCKKCRASGRWLELFFRWDSIRALAKGSSLPLCGDCQDNR